MPGPKRAHVVTVNTRDITVGDAEKLNAMAKQGVPGFEAVPDGLHGTLKVVIDSKKAPAQLLEGTSQERK